MKGEKSEQRRVVRRRLRQIPPEKADRDATALADRVLALPEMERASDVFLCLSFGGEIDTWRLADGLRDLGKRIYVPRAVLRDHSLHVHAFPCRLETLPIGLRQPAADDSELANDDIEGTLDIALVLGLAFDPRGVRLGHGSGFFDRFLARYPLQTVGLAYDEQIVEELPRETHDVPMGRVVTPSRVLTPD